MVTLSNCRIELPDILANPVVAAVAEKHGKAKAQVLLRHLVQKGFAVIPKSTNPDRIRQNIEIFDFELDERDMEKLNGLDRGPDARILNFKGVFPG